MAAQDQGLPRWAQVGRKCRWWSESQKTFHPIVITHIDKEKRRVVAHFEADHKVWKTVPYTHVGRNGPLQPPEGLADSADASGYASMPSEQMGKAKEGKDHEDGTSTPPWYEQLGLAETRDQVLIEQKKRQEEQLMVKERRRYAWREQQRIHDEEKEQARQLERKEREEAAEQNRIEIVQRIQRERQEEDRRLWEVHAMEAADEASARPNAVWRQREAAVRRQYEEELRQAEEEERQKQEEQFQRSLSMRSRITFGVKQKQEPMKIVIPQPEPTGQPAPPSLGQQLPAEDGRPPGVLEEMSDPYNPGAYDHYAGLSAGYGYDPSQSGYGAAGYEEHPAEVEGGLGDEEPYNDMYQGQSRWDSTHTGPSAAGTASATARAAPAVPPPMRVPTHSAPDRAGSSRSHSLRRRSGPSARVPPTPPAKPPLRPMPAEPPPPPARSLSGSFSPDRTEEYGKLIREIYEVHNPAKLVEVPRLLEKYAGSEAEMYERICDKYQVQPMHPPKRGGSSRRKSSKRSPKESVPSRTRAPAVGFARKASAPAPVAEATSAKSAGSKPPPTLGVSSKSPAVAPSQAPSADSLMARFASLVSDPVDESDEKDDDNDQSPYDAQLEYDDRPGLAEAGVNPGGSCEEDDYPEDGAGCPEDRLADERRLPSLPPDERLRDASWKSPSRRPFPDSRDRRSGTQGNKGSHSRGPAYDDAPYRREGNRGPIGRGPAYDDDRREGNAAAHHRSRSSRERLGGRDSSTQPFRGAYRADNDATYDRPSRGSEAADNAGRDAGRDDFGRDADRGSSGLGLRNRNAGRGRGSNREAYHAPPAPPRRPREEPPSAGAAPTRGAYDSGYDATPRDRDRGDKGAYDSGYDATPRGRDRGSKGGYDSGYDATPRGRDRGYDYEAPHRGEDAASRGDPRDYGRADNRGYRGGNNYGGNNYSGGNYGGNNNYGGNSYASGGDDKKDLPPWRRGDSQKAGGYEDDSYRGGGGRDYPAHRSQDDGYRGGGGRDYARNRGRSRSRDPPPGRHYDTPPGGDRDMPGRRYDAPVGGDRDRGHRRDNMDGRDGGSRGGYYGGGHRGGRGYHNGGY